jgi:hypothetical protein
VTELAHEVWKAPGSFEFGLPASANDAIRQPDARMIHVIYAASYVAAMRAYHRWQGWGEYLTADGFGDAPYTAEQLVEQKALRPEYY